MHALSKKTKPTFANDLDIGARIAVAYQLSNRINIEAEYYIDINKLFSNNYYSYHNHLIDQSTVGIRYALINK